MFERLRDLRIFNNERIKNSERRIKKSKYKNTILLVHDNRQNINELDNKIDSHMRN